MTERYVAAANVSTAVCDVVVVVAVALETAPFDKFKLPVTSPVTSPTKLVAVTTPTKKPLPSGLNVVPLPTSTPLLAVMRPTESILVTSS